MSLSLDRAVPGECPVGRHLLRCLQRTPGWLWGAAGQSCRGLWVEEGREEGGRAGKCPSGAGKGQTENSLPEAEGRGWLSIWAPLPLSTLQFYEAGCDPLRVEPLQISWDVVEAAVACNLEFEHGVLRVEEGLRTVLLGDTHAGTTQTQGVSRPAPGDLA